jgi:hypothetical protein
MGPGSVGIRVHVLPLNLNYHISFVKNSHSNNNPSGHFRQQAAASDSALFLVKDAV